MPWNWFCQILRFIYVVDNTNAPSHTDPEYDKLRKVHTLLNVFAASTPQLYGLHHQVSIVESIIGTKCRLSFIQYMPKKLTKWWIKVWVCSDAHNNYIDTFDIYTGANLSAPDNPKGQACDVVLR